MQMKKFVAGALGVLMLSSSVALAASTLDQYPKPFITTQGSPDFLVVVGAAAAPSDVVGAIDLATRLGGETGTIKTVPGSSSTGVTGEGSAVGTTNTPVFLGDTLGKVGLRTSMTKTELPTLLASGVVDDSDNSTTSPYNQYIQLTPSSTTSANFIVQFDKPGSTSTIDPTYNFGRFTTTPSDTNYWYKTQVIFDKDVGNTAVGETINLFGKMYTITSGTDFQQSTATNNKLVLSGSAETTILNGQETVTVTINGISYEVTLQGVTSTPKALVKVVSPTATDAKEVAVGSQTTIAGLDVFVDRATQLSTTDQTVNSAKLLLGSQKVTLQHGSTVKVGTNDDSVQGTYVTLTTNGGKLSSFNVYVGGKDSNTDYLKLGGTYMDPVWQSFSVEFPSVTPALDSTDGRSTISVTPSGDNLMQVGYTDTRGYQKTITYGNKFGGSATNFTLADDSGYTIHNVENDTVNQFEYFMVDSGDFTHMYRLDSASMNSNDANTKITLKDMFSGATTDITMGNDLDNGNVVLDGQSYYINGNVTGTGTTSNSIRVTWGTNAGLQKVGSYQTIWPKLKGDKGQYLVFTEVNTTINDIVNSTASWQLPTGAVSLTAGGGASTVTFAATTQEDGTASSCTGCGALNYTAAGKSIAFRLGKTTAGGALYNVTVKSSGAVYLNVVQDQGGNNNNSVSSPGILLLEEKDNNNDLGTVWIGMGTETSGSNNVAIATAPTFSMQTGSSSSTGAGGVTGVDSNNIFYVDYYGTYVKRNTNGQDTITAWYPDNQVTMDVFVTASDAVISTATTESGMYRAAAPIKTAISKLDTEVIAADKTTHNVILVGGPAVNTLVADLAAAGKTNDVTWYRTQGQGTALIQVIDDAFATGKAALVVAGHSADDTRTVTGYLQAFEDHLTDFQGKNIVVYKNGVLSTSTA